MSTVHSALLAPNFTKFGWGLMRALPDPVEELIENMKQGLESERMPEESVEYQVNHEYLLELLLVVSNGQLNTRALREVKPIH